MTEPVKHDARWLHSNGFDSMQIGNIRGAKLVANGERPAPFTTATREGEIANLLYGLVGKLALILDEKEGDE